jgi:hypothetical protein
MQQCFSEIPLGRVEASCFGLMGASHFEKAVRGGFALIDFLFRVESPKATLIFTDSCARRVPCTPLRQVPGGLHKLQRSLGAARISARRRAADFRGIQKSHTGEDWFCGAWVARNGGPFSHFCQAVCVQIFARLRGLGTRAPRALAVGEVHGDFSLRLKMTGPLESGKQDMAGTSGPFSRQPGGWARRVLLAECRRDRSRGGRRWPACGRRGR